MNFNRLYLIWVLLVFTGLFCNNGISKEHELISRDHWAKYSKNYDYTENYKTLEQQKKNSSNRLASPVNRLVNYSETVKIIVFSVVLIILLVLLILIVLNLSKIKGNKKITGNQGSILQNIENIDELNFEQLLNEYIKEKKYKEALHIRYLKLLRDLNSLAYIVWKKDKSNGTYVREMYQKTGYQQFFSITLIFDRIWYGEKNLNETDYYQLVPLMDSFENIINKDGQ